MRQTIRLALLVVTFILLTSAALSASAQTPAQDRLNALQTQLDELQVKQLDLQQRLQLLDEQLKPENIEKSLAGVGSTHPEELREQKRKQLEIEKTGVQKQLNLLADNRIRLESSIAQATADAYHQSAKVATGSDASPSQSTVQPEKRTRKSKARPRRVRSKTQ